MYRRKSVFCETSSSETVPICNSSLPILQHFSYIQLLSKGQKCPISQVTDLYFAAKLGTSDLLAQTQSKNQHSIALYIRKTVRESEQTNHISSQSPKRLFRKIQIFSTVHITTSAVLFLFRVKNRHCIVLFTKSVIQCFRRESSFRKIQIFEFAY